MAEDAQAVVIDNGSGICKAGIAGDDVPKACFPAIIGKPRYQTIVGTETKDEYIGNDAVPKRGVCNISYPVENGVINDWEGMTKVWKHCYYNELRCEPTDQPVHLTEAPKNPLENREKMMQIFFETFEVPAFHVTVQAVLALYASGRTTGLVFDAGDGVTHLVPVYEGYALKHAVERVNLAGRELSQHLMDILQESNVKFSSTAEFDISKNIKEQKCYVALDYEAEMKEFQDQPEKQTEYELPDGQVIKFGNQQIRVPEVLFKPQMLGKDFQGIHHTSYRCVQKCDIDVRRELLENIILSGGSTMFPGIVDRMKKEIEALVPANVSVKIVAPNERKYSVWIGGSVLSTLATFQTMWITRGEYDEVGASVVHRKCY